MAEIHLVSVTNQGPESMGAQALHGPSGGLAAGPNETLLAASRTDQILLLRLSSHEAQWG